MNKVPQRYIDKLLDLVDLIDVVKERIHVHIKEAEHSANCPFHNDNSESLKIDTSTNTYSCAECDVEGSAIGFVMYFDGVHFFDSLRILSESVGMDIRSVLSDEDMARPREGSKAILTEVSRYYQDCLLGNQGAINYLHSRGLSEDTIGRFEIGFAPLDREHLFDVFPNQKAKLLQSGVAGRTDKGLYFSRFRNRITFPVKDEEGSIVGFGARSIDGNEPKYLNSPSSALFQKSELLYGLDAARRIENQYDAIVVEGYLDVVGLSQAGLPNVIAPLGTSLSASHVKVFTNKYNSVCLCFDGDGAGHRATLKAIEQIFSVDTSPINVFVAVLPPDTDPDSYVLDRGVKAFQHILDSAILIEEFYLSGFVNDLDTDQIGNVAAAFAKLKPVVQNIASKSRKESIVTMLSKRYDLDLVSYFS